MSSRHSPLADRWLKRAGGLAAFLSFGLVAGALGSLAFTYRLPIKFSWGFHGFILPTPLIFSTVGWLVTSRLPRHPIGWLFHWTGLGFAVQAFTEEYAVYALMAHPGSLPGGDVFAWIDNWVWIPALGPAVTLLFLFPNGRLLSPRWWPVVGFLILGVVSLTVGYALLPGPMQSSLPISNPFGVASTLPARAISLGFPLLLTAILAAAASVGLRLRRAEGVEREQIKWLVYAAGLVPLVVALDFAVGPNTLFAEIATLIAILAVPVAVGVAILRYRLYDIDLIIRRTLVYSVLTAALALVYFGSVALFQGLLAAVSREQSPVAVVASTLVIAALFAPLRRRVQEFIDRRFYRRKYDAARTLAEFAAAARDETDLEQLTGRLVAVVEDTMQPARVGLWLAENPEVAAEKRGARRSRTEARR